MELRYLRMLMLALFLILPPALSDLRYRNDAGRAVNATIDVTGPLAIGANRLPRGTVNDVVSRNITMVLENLLMNYENSQLPTHGKGKPTVVKTNIYIRSMGPISELDMDYSMDCYFRQYWRDTRLSFLGPIKSLSLSIKMLERIWRPDTYFYNGKQSYVHTITVPNKLLRITQEGDILYSMRLTIKAKCTMDLRNFPMDRQSCPLILGSYAYTSGELVYEWQDNSSVNFVPGMALSQFDLMGYPYRNLTFVRREGEFSVLQVSFNLQRHTGYFLIQVYVPCVLIVVLSWVSFWIHREATSDRVGLGITTVLTLSTISLDSRKDLPKVKYATALDWFLLMSFGYCIATLLEFAGVHYFTKVGSGEFPVEEEFMEEEEVVTSTNEDVNEPEWEDIVDPIPNDSDKDDGGFTTFSAAKQLQKLSPGGASTTSRKRGSSLFSALYNDQVYSVQDPPRSMTITVSSKPSTMERQTQTELWLPKWRQFFYCLVGDMAFRKRRQREAADGCRRHGERIERYINSVSYIDRVARIVFPASFTLLIVCYWMVYVTYQEEFKWQDPPMGSASHRLGESEKQQRRQAEEIDWKEEQTSSDRGKIEISGSKAEDSSLQRRLKSATLDRMGRILKISNPKSSGEKPEMMDGPESRSEESTRKQKFNSLTRMLRFVDKEADSKSPGQYRGRSMTRILRKKASIESDNPSDQPDEQPPGIFSRIIGQIRARVSRSNSSSNKDAPSKLDDKTVTPSKSPSSLTLSELNLESSTPIVSIRQEA